MIEVPRDARKATLKFSLLTETDEEDDSTDSLALNVRSQSGKLLKTLATFKGQGAEPRYRPKAFDLTAYRGSTVKIEFSARTSAAENTIFTVRNPHFETQ